MSALATNDKKPTPDLIHWLATGKTLQTLSIVNGPRACRSLIFDWMVCALVIGTALFFANPVLQFLAIVIVGTRQHAMLIMVHEGVHHRLTQSRRLNDIISNLFAAYPIFFCTQGYRINHLVHHRETNTERDPDWVRKVRLWEWQFPKSRQDLAKAFGLVLLTSWYKMIVLFWQLSALNYKAAKTSPVQMRWLVTKLGFYALMVGVLYYTRGWSYFALYWLTPYFFVMPIVERVRSISEHFGLSYANDFNQTRNILCTKVEGFFFGPHNVRYHLDHHLFPTVPQYNLPALHSYLMTIPEFAQQAHQNTSYIFGKKSVLNDILTTRGEDHVKQKIRYDN